MTRVKGAILGVVTGLSVCGTAAAADDVVSGSSTFSIDMLYQSQAPTMVAQGGAKAFLGSSPWLPSWMAAKRVEFPTTSSVLGLNPSAEPSGASAAFRFDLGWGATAHVAAAVRDTTLGIGQSNVAPQGGFGFGRAGASYSAVPNLGFGAPWAGNVLSSNPVGAQGFALPNGVVARPGSDYGYGVQGGLTINLPQITPGDALWLQAAYGHGAANVAGPNQTPGSTIQSGTVTTRLQRSMSDGFVDSFGNYKPTDSYSATAAFLHHWAPQWRSSFVASWTRFEGGGARPGSLGQGGPAFTNVIVKDANQYSGSASLVYSPTKDLDLGVEVYYTRFDPVGRIMAPSKLGIGKSIGFDDELFTRFRVEKNF